MTSVKSEKRKGDAGEEVQKKRPRKDAETEERQQRKPFNAGRFQGGGARAPHGQRFVHQKKDWKVYKQQKKELKVKRKEKQKNKDIMEIMSEAKKIYEELKCKTTKGRAEIAAKLHNMLKTGDRYSKMVLAHDTARVVQCLLKVASPEIRAEIFGKLTESLPAMAMSKYAHFCVLAMLKHGSAATRLRLIEALYGNYVKLCSHSFGHTIVDSIYITWATAQQKSCMRQEFYSDLYRKDKDSTVKCLVDTFKDASHMKNIVLGNLKQHIMKAVNKKLVDNSLFHGVLVEYLAECSEEDRLEMATAFTGLLASLASTREGTKAATLCFWYGTAKERRSALKHLREHVEKVCVHEFGYFLILAVLHTIDDTKMLKKMLLDTIVEKVEALVQHEGGRKVVEWVIQPGDTSNFHPSFTTALNEGLKYSKKDANIRQAEILEATHADLVAAVISNSAFWLSNGHIARTMATILLAKEDEKTAEAFQGIAKVISDPCWMLMPQPKPEPEDGEEEVDELKPKKKFKKVKNPLEKPPVQEAEEAPKVGVEDAGLHIVLKKLLKNPSFAATVLENLTEDTLEKWLPINRGCFLLVDLLKSAPEAEKLTGMLQKCRDVIATHKSPGAKMLLEKIQ
ncbi:protein penguin [Phlebotomus argentipes]|uniref:protein penguin n=1 Tax=Phlebotomus argentipes TaxID=94469 RepID=UPI002892FE45|nr:protein penguin [Phlebotomus argentipes]